MSNPEASNEKVWFSQRGICHLPLGGQDRVLRFRTSAIRQLEKELRRSVLDVLSSPDAIGIDFVHTAIMVGVAPEFAKAAAAAKRKKGKKPQALTEALVDGWIDECDGEDGRLDLEELTDAVVKVVIGGLPNGAQMLADMKKAEAARLAAAEAEDDDEGDERPTEAPKEARKVDPMSLLASSGPSSS